MYGVSATASGAGLAATGAGVLAHTGFNFFWMLITAATLFMAGVVLLRLRPKDEY